MKIKFLFLFILLTYCSILHSQNPIIPDYTSETGWRFFTAEDPESVDPVDNWKTPRYIANPNGMNNRIYFSDNAGGIYYDNVEDGDQIQGAEWNMGAALCNRWVTTFDFMPTAIGTSIPEESVGHIVFMYTNGAGNVFRYNDDYWSTPPNGLTTTYPDNDVIGVFFGTEEESNELMFSAFMKDDDNQPIWAQDNVIIGDPNDAIGRKYKITLERLDDANGRLTVERYDASGEEIEEIYPSICFDIAPTIENLNHIQHTNSIHSSRERILSGTVNHLELQDCYVSEECCTPTQIIGPSTLCDVPDETYTYTVEGGGSNLTYAWIIPNGVSYQGNNDEETLVITDWGNLTSTTLFVDIYCGCRHIGTLSIDVNIRPDLSPYALVSAGSTPINQSSIDIDVYHYNPAPTSLNTTSTFELYRTTSHHSLCQPSSGLLNSVTDPSTLPFSWSNWDDEDTYLVIHTISYSDGSCPQTDCATTSSSSRISGGNTGYYQSVPIRASVYPNPSTGVININYSNEDYSNAKIIVKDALGKTVIERSITNQNTELNIPSNGIFLVEIWEGDILESVEKIIISE